jgi:molybdopterin-guanine dinucleotide biosynthesis protein
MKPKVIVIAGTASNVGKTTLLCDLLRELAQHETWEAIKLTRGHYRSCGKDPHACCVSHLLGDAPTIRSGRVETYTPGKDTARFWDAGASNVHWVIATDAQVEQGVNQALARVQSGQVLIEGTSVLRFIESELAILVLRGDETKLKPSARRALADRRIDAVYVNERSAELLPALAERRLIESLPLYTRDTQQALIARFTADAVAR